MESIDFAKEIIDTINKRRDAGMSLNEALDGTGVNRDTYYKAMRSPGTAKRKLESIQKLKYVDHCYTQRGMGTDEIATLLGVTRGQVNKYLRKLGIEHKPRERKRKISPERAAAEDKERNLLERMINVEMRTLIEISQETGLSTSVIKTRIKRYGIVRGENARKRLKKGDTADSNPLRQIIVKEWKPIKMEQRQWFTL